MNNRESQVGLEDPAKHEKLLGWKIFWLSFALLFGEVMAVRWLGVELPIVRVFPNLVVMVVMVAVSSGLAGSARAAKLSPLWQLLLVSFSALVLIVPLIFSVPLGLPQLVLRVDPAKPEGVFLSLIVLTLIIVALYISFLRVGNALGQAFGKLPPLRAYSWNLLGSLLGVAVFAIISWSSLGPWAWILILGAVLYFLFSSKTVLALTIATAILAFFCVGNASWSPYSKLEIRPILSAPGSVLGDGNYVLYANNSYFHFALRMFDDLERKQFEKESESSEQGRTIAFYQRWLKIPFDCAPKHEKVLVLGGGSGNDVAFAVAAGAKQVDVVEIDPLICDLGKKIHPNKPYINPLVRLHNEDARTFLRHCEDKFDLIEFAFLDPGTTINSAAFLRVDNYVYTVESMRTANRLLNDYGVCCVTFATGADSGVTKRLYQTISEAIGKPPLAYTSEAWKSVIFLFGPGVHQLPAELMAAAEIQPYPQQGQSVDSLASTDQWPFLYLQYDAGGMWIYFLVLFAGVVLPAGVLFKRSESGISSGEWANMFFLGQAFMLMETKSITHLSLLLGATWIVSSAVIFCILVLAYLANLWVSKAKTPPVAMLYGALAVLILVQYFLQIPELTFIPPSMVSLLFIIIDCLPVMFGSMIFSICFAKTKYQNQALAANLLGVSLGGLTENICVVTGISGLSLIALLLYGLSFLAFSKIPKPAQVTNVES